ncbi:hypothetical protein VTJ83DRAFT_5856 [Remersonia thermophila]|uniref:Peptidase S26 domain-containing protein n=1 Tax=Remersonia thermophila TaxID=72144 RepID=A0ABR4DA93_9PEZI
MSSTTLLLRGLFRPSRCSPFSRRTAQRLPHHTASSSLPPPPSHAFGLRRNASSSPNPSPSNLTTNSGNGNPHHGQPPSWLGHPLRVILTTIKFVAFAHLIWEYGISMAPASGPSMLPTFEVLGEWLLVSKLHRFGRGVTVGDVVAYNIPINDEVGVKRVLGLPGDYVLMETPDGMGGGNMIQVPQGHCWIVGDNLVASRDSRYFGPVPLALIRGKVIATVRPLSEFKWITNPLKKEDGPTED